MVSHDVNQSVSLARRPINSAARVLPDGVVHRFVAWSFRLFREQRMLFLDELVDPHRGAIDVGSWWGPWSYWLSRRCPAVWTFEPNPRLARTLKRVLRPNVQVEQVGLSDRAGTATLYLPHQFGNDSLATLEIGQKMVSADEIPIEVRRLDDYSFNDIGFVKIDVEGHELAMLKGSVELFQRCRPTVLIEVEQRFHERPITEIFSILTNLNYSGWIRRERRWEPLSTFSVERDQYPFQHTPKDTRYINNFVFTPTHKSPGI